MERKWWTLVVVCIATFMLLLDITIVNVALPKIASDLNASFSDIQWVIDAYALTLASLLLTAGSLADLLGRKLVFSVGLVLFSLTSLLCALSPSALFLIIARAGQGIGGAIMFSCALALLAQEFHGKERGTAFGAWGATIAASAAIGPLLGGFLTEDFGWSSIFYINVPIGIVCVALTLAKVQESRNPEARKVDWIGTVTFTGALFLIVFAIIRGNAEGWGSTMIVSLFTAGFLLLIIFLISQFRQKNAMFDVTLFRKPTFSGASIVAFTISSAMFAMFLYLVLYIQTILGLSPLQTGPSVPAVHGRLVLRGDPVGQPVHARSRALPAEWRAAADSDRALLDARHHRHLGLDRAAAGLHRRGRGCRAGEPSAGLDGDRRRSAAAKRNGQSGSTTPSARWG